jgi:hypothetical protein
MRSSWSLVAAAAVVIGQMGCATIFTGTSQDVTIASEPTKASVKVVSAAGLEVYTGSTPATVVLPKKKEYVVTLTLDGYEQVKVPISQSFQTMVIGNIICGGIPGGVIDLLTGAFWVLEPEAISVTLKRPGAAWNGQGGSSDMLDVEAGAGAGRVVAVFRAMDKDGQVRELSIPLTPTRESLAAR